MKDLARRALRLSLIPLLILPLFTPVLSMIKNKTCKNDSLVVWEVDDYNIGGNNMKVTHRRVKQCDYGCNIDSNECYPAPHIRYAWVGGLILLIIGLVYGVSRWA